MDVFTVVNIIQILGLILAFLAIILLLRSDRTEIQHDMLVFMLGVFVHNSAFLLELNCKTLDAALVATRMEYLGSSFVVLFFCKFALNYCNVKVNQLFFHVLAFIDGICVTVMWSCQYHKLFYTSISYTQDGFYPHLVLTYGPFFYIFFAVALIIPYMVSFIAFIRSYYKSRGRKISKHYGIYATISTIPPVILIFYIAGLFNEFDIAPVVLMYALSLVVIFVWSKSNYDLTNVATRTFIMEIDDSVIILDEDMKIMLFNPATRRLFTQISDAHVGTFIYDIAGFPMELFESENKRWEFNLDGNYYDSHIKAMYDYDNNLRGYAITIFDITEKQKYIEDIDAMRRDAEAANMAKNDFIANMSHEIRTPMNAIVGLSELIKEECRGRKVYTFACDITNASHNLLGIINSILDISTLESGKMEIDEEQYSPKELLDNIRSTMNVASSQHGIEFKYEAGNNLPKILSGDTSKLQQILLNILNNAIKFTEHGYVMLKTSFEKVTDEKGMLIFEISDTGIGIKKEDIAHIFDSFSQVDSKRGRTAEGTGLGLSISKKLAELMHGRISVDSVVGEGSVFTVAIPQKIIDGTVENNVFAVKTGGDKKENVFTVKDCKVLVVDDNKINRKVALGMLKPYGFELMDAESGKEALELVKDNLFDIIFMDHMMPEMDGVETTRRIREDFGENGRYPVIIALTANAMDGARELFLNNGFEDFLPKPVDRKVMHQILSKWIEDDRKVAVTENAVDNSISLDDISGIFIKGVSIVDALENHTGTLDDYLEILKLFYMQGKEKIPQILELVEQEDWVNYRIEVHGLKGASANIGALELSAEAKKHEDAATDNDIDFILKNVDALIDMFKTLIDEIKVVLDKQSKYNSNNEANSGEEISMQVLGDKLKQASEYIENFKSKECLKVVSEILQYRLNSDLKIMLEEVELDLKLYKDDEAEELLAKIVAEFNQMK